MNQGLIHLYYGTGKGKTTAAMGLCLRAAGWCKQVTVVQFLKDGTSSELNILRVLPNVTVITGNSEGFTFTMDEDAKKRTQAVTKELFERAVTSATDAHCEVLLLDEVCHVLSAGFLDGTVLEQFLDGKPKGLEVILTGRTPPESLLKRADYVTEMVCHKHPYEQGTSAREGIEF